MLPSRVTKFGKPGKPEISKDHKCSDAEQLISQETEHKPLWSLSRYPLGLYPVVTARECKANVDAKYGSDGIGLDFKISANDF
jgi:hypothetical protein